MNVNKILYTHNINNVCHIEHCYALIIDITQHINILKMIKLLKYFIFKT